MRWAILLAASLIWPAVTGAQTASPPLILEAKIPLDALNPGPRLVNCILQISRLAEHPGPVDIDESKCEIDVLTRETNVGSLGAQEFFSPAKLLLSLRVFTPCRWMRPILV